MRGQVWLVAFDPSVGSEIQKTRPAVVISPPEMHDHLRTAIVAAMASKGQFAAYRVPVRFQQVEGLILLDQIRAVDKRRLIRRLGDLEPETLRRVLETLGELFAP